ncbi:MAG: heavy metal translocating P-type ATPase, partial [Ottowia sp.]|nr:heavy metal translocating P-type ATPase [Ottowia sp.]
MTTESITWRIPNMDCAAEESEIRHALRDVAGVQRLAFRLGARELRVDAAPGALPEVAQRLRAAGFAPQVPGAPKAAAAEGPACDSAACGPMQLSTHDHQHDDHGHGHEHDHHHDHDHDHADEAATGWRTLLLAPGLPRIGAALVLALAAEAVHALAPGGWAAVGMGLAVAAVLLSGLSTYLKGVNALRRGRLNISALMAVAVTGALLIGQWPEAAMVMALYALAEHLEARAVDRARGAIGGLLQMAPDTVEQRAADGTWQAVAAAEVPVGAVMRVKPGARLALDGVVTAGQSAIDQSPVTGESLPVDKALGDAVYAGTLNQSGVLEVRVTAAAQDTQLARIIHAVEQAQSERAPTQAFIDRFAAVYTPAVFVLALGVALLGPWLAGWTWLTAIYKALVLLVIACPCALVIATPVTVVSALANAARRGVLVKGGVYLENARRLKAVALDKTGTLTEGKPVLVASEILSKTELSAYVLPAAAALSAQSDHPVSRAIAQGLASQDVTA